MKDDLTKSVTFFNFYRIIGEIEKNYRNWTSIVGINDTITNFITSNYQARPCINFSKLSSRNFETNVSLDNFIEFAGTITFSSEYRSKPAESFGPCVGVMAAAKPFPSSFFFQQKNLR